jgi:hypothetical protein
MTSVCAPVATTATANAIVKTNAGGTISNSFIAPATFWWTPGLRLSTFTAFTQNGTRGWAILIPYSLTASTISYAVATADNTANLYDIGLYNASGTLVADIGATAGTTFAPTASPTYITLTFAQGVVTFPPGLYMFEETTNCPSACALLAATNATQNLQPFSTATPSSGNVTSNGALNNTIGLPVVTWNGNTPGPFIGLH